MWVIGLGELLFGDEVNGFPLVDNEGGGFEELLLLLKAAALEVEELVGLGLAQGDLEEEVGFGILLSHVSGYNNNLSYLEWVKIITEAP